MRVVAHEPGRKFDLEDRRIVTLLTRFAAAAYDLLKSFNAADVDRLSRLHARKEGRGDLRS